MKYRGTMVAEFCSDIQCLTAHGQRLSLLCIESEMDITTPHGKG